MLVQSTSRSISVVTIMKNSQLGVKVSLFTYPSYYTYKLEIELSISFVFPYKLPYASHLCSIFDKN